MCAVIFLFLFLCFHLFFISLFFFSDHFFSDKYNNRRGTKGKRRRDGTGMYAGGDSNVGRHGGGRRGQRVRLLLFFVLSTLLFYSHHSSSFPIVSFSVEYDNRRAGRDGPTRAAIVTRDGTGGQAGTTGTSSVALFLPTLLFSSSYFYNLCCRELQQQTGRGRVGRDRTERDGGQAGGRRR